MSSPPILNPDVYLNYLIPSIASQYELNRNMTLATLGALIWDILSSIPSDYRLMQMGRASVVLFAYFVARPASMVMVLLAILLFTGPVLHCGAVALGVATCQVVSSAAASYLFLKRVHAVYFGNKVLQHIFNFLWLVGVGTSCAVFAGVYYSSLEIADTKHCIRRRGSSALEIAFMDPVLFDTLVYFAITHKILITHTTRGGWRALFRGGRVLPHFSRAVLQGGQQYYLITIGITLTRFALSLSPASPTLQVILSSPAVSLTSVMACRVHRNLIIQSMDNGGGSGMERKIPGFSDTQVVDIPLPRKLGPMSPDGGYDVRHDSAISEAEV
ncbi:hypothetical protein BKA82DRAFT_129866 [Pisolithus tinctorius]|uniref:Uncharacterized protein n=1 Tax=Pisolithus tinctorius Marx 270 TaxID=870435 RepID=A0A0C3PN20_PISTI|nr:hypothetical protein BKA82DRAFT_129866 [Pisolithus tinctorius]KIO10216.1 hypothetical protein M404DRAFT_129866 [Pisolithus tinctorius Marx 270]